MINNIIDNLTKPNGARVICLSGLSLENSQTVIANITKHFSITAGEVWQAQELPLSITEVRDLTKWIIQKPLSGKDKIVILSLDNIKHEAANALLKTLEEPPNYAIIVATISEQGKLLPTIKSRVQLYYAPGARQSRSGKKEIGSLAAAFSTCGVDKTMAEQIMDAWLVELGTDVRDGNNSEDIEKLLEYKSFSQINCNPKILLENAFLVRYKKLL